MSREKMPDLLLERFLLGEVTSREREELATELGKEKEGFTRLEKLKNSNEEILAKYSPGEMAERIRTRFEARQRVERAAEETEGKKKGAFGFQFRLAFSAVAVVFVAVLLAIPVLNLNMEKGGGVLLVDGTRIKGDAKLFIYRKTANGEESLRDGDPARKGDNLQLAYMAGSEKFGMIFSIDGNGSLTWHYPYNLQDEAGLSTGKKTYLKEGYLLDNAPRYERFFFVMSDKKLDISEMIGKANVLAGSHATALDKAKEIFEGYKVIAFTLVKEDAK